jgi:hypothetical protein
MWYGAARRKKDGSAPTTSRSTPSRSLAHTVWLISTQHTTQTVHTSSIHTSTSIATMLQWRSHCHQRTSCTKSQSQVWIRGYDCFSDSIFTHVCLSRAPPGTPCQGPHQRTHHGWSFKLVGQTPRGCRQVQTRTLPCVHRCAEISTGCSTWHYPGP